MDLRLRQRALAPRTDRSPGASMPMPTGIAPRDDLTAVADLLVAGVEDQGGRSPSGRGRHFSGSSSSAAAARLSCGLVASGPQCCSARASTSRADTPCDLHLGHRQLEVPLAADAPIRGRGVELHAPRLGHLDAQRPGPGMDGLGLVAVRVAPAQARTALRARPRRRVGPLQLHDLVKQDGDGPGQAVEAALGEPSRDPVRGGQATSGEPSSVVSLGMVGTFRGNRGRPAASSPMVTMEGRRNSRNQDALPCRWGVARRGRSGETRRRRGDTSSCGGR